MKAGTAVYAKLDDTKRRIYEDGMTNSRPILGHLSWDAENGAKLDSKAVFSSGVLEVPYGGEIAEHKHSGREEVYYVLSGVGEGTIDGVTVKMEPGTCFWFPANCSHKINNKVKDSTLLLFFVTAVVGSGKMSHD